MIPKKIPMFVRDHGSNGPGRGLDKTGHHQLDQTKLSPAQMGMKLIIPHMHIYHVEHEISLQFDYKISYNFFFFLNNR